MQIHTNIAQGVPFQGWDISHTTFRALQCNHAEEIELRGSFRFGNEFDQAVALIVEGKIHVQQLITARRPLADTPEAMRLALDRSQSIKVVLEA